MSEVHSWLCALLWFMQRQCHAMRCNTVECTVLVHHQYSALVIAKLVPIVPRTHARSRCAGELSADIFSDV